MRMMIVFKDGSQALVSVWLLAIYVITTLAIVPWIAVYAIWPHQVAATISISRWFFIGGALPLLSCIMGMAIESHRPKVAATGS